MAETINVLCATDDNYVPYCGIMLTSLFENNKDVRVDVYVLIDKPLSKRSQRRFEKLTEQYGNGISFLIIDKSFLEKFPTKGMSYWSIAMYYRIFAEQLVPNHVDRILYLDCDIIVRSNIKSLWEIDMTHKAVGVVPDIMTTCDVNIYERLQYPSEAGYFNSGVLLINLGYWRECKISQQCLDYLSENYDRLFANDQDVLNAVLWDKKITLPLRYNYQIQYLSNYFFNLQSDNMKKEVLDTYNNPIIIHYAHAIKPWAILYYKKPFLQEWEYYKNISQWSSLWRTLPQNKTINFTIKRFILWPLGLMHYDSGFIKEK